MTGESRIDAHDLAAMFASYEMDEPHVELPDCPLDEPQVYPDVTADDIREWLAMEHHGDCVKMPCSCSRCAAEMWLHKAQWMLRQMGEDVA